MTSTPPPEGLDGQGQDGRRRIRPYLSTPTADGQDAAGDDTRAHPRPFVLTAGRVEATDPRIGLETQVAARVGVPVGSLAPQLRAILDACVQPVSVAEISARLRLHLGVTQILIGDLRSAGLVDVHTVDHNQAHDPDMILRVIHGLRAIS